MKKLLAVATIAVVGYKVVKKIKERKNNDEVEVNEVEEETVVDEELEDNEVEENVKEDLFKIFKHNIVNFYENVMELPINIILAILKVLIIGAIDKLFKAFLFIGLMCANAGRCLKNKLHEKYDIIM